MHHSIHFFLVLVVSGSVFSQIKHRFILLDQGTSKLEFVDQFDTTKNWTTAISGSSRDLQLVGNNRILVGVMGGYDEVDLKTGAVVKQVTGLGSGIESVQRLPNGNTMLCSPGLGGQNGTGFVEIDSAKKIVQKFSFPGTGGLRIMRRSPAGTYFFGAGNDIIEGDTTGKVLWRGNTAKAPGIYTSPNNYQATRLQNGNVLVATGHGANLTILDKAGNCVKTYGGTIAPQAAQVKPNFYAMFQVLANGHIVVSNWHPSDPGNCIQVLEYDTTGQMVWFFKDPSRISAIHGVLVIDSLDTQLAYNDMNGGVLMPMNRNVSVFYGISCFQPLQGHLRPDRQAAFGTHAWYSPQGKLLRSAGSNRGSITGFGSGVYIRRTTDNGVMKNCFLTVH